jgi:hypothetical protein
MIEMKSTNTREFLFIWKTKKNHFPRIIGTCLQNNLEQERLTKQSGKMHLEVITFAGYSKIQGRSICFMPIVNHQFQKNHSSRF